MRGVLSLLFFVVSYSLYTNKKLDIGLFQDFLQTCIIVILCYLQQLTCRADTEFWKGVRSVSNCCVLKRACFPILGALKQVLGSSP